MRWVKRKEECYGCLVENGGFVESGDDSPLGECGIPRSGNGAFDFGARYNGVRDSRRRAGGHSHPGDHRVPSKAARALERHRRWNQRLVIGGRCVSGQSTVEFAVIAAAFLAIAVALVAFWRIFSGGLVVEHALAVASHHIQAVAPTTIVDIFLY